LLGILFAAILAYLVGSIPTSYIFAKLLKGIDIREHGSGNVGATNLMRTVGKAPGVIALILDAGKGLFAVIFIASAFYWKGFPVSEPLFRVILGVLAVSGHIWTIFLRFKGGKGVATAIGVFLGLSPIVTTISLLIWLILVLIFRYVSLGSIAMALSMPILMLIFKAPFEYVVLAITLCLFICYKHKANIKRLLAGTEYKIGQRIKE